MLSCRVHNLFILRLCIVFTAISLLLIPIASYAQEAPDKVKEPADAKKIFVPTFIEAKFEVTPKTFVADETVILDGIIAFDQAMSIHWDELTPERLDFKPFKALKVVIGPQRPFNQESKFFADYRSVQILLAPPEAAKNGVHKISGFNLGYSYFSETSMVKKNFSVGPFAISKLPIKMSASLSPDVLHLGEKASITVKIEREKSIRVLNQFLAVLKDDAAAESDKTEIQRFIASLEARKESAFNLAAPDIKPFKVLDKSVVEVERQNSIVSIYTYRVAYYEVVRPLLTLPPVKIWYMVKKINSEYQDPEVLISQPLQLSVVSRLIGKDRRLDGPQLLPNKVSGFTERYYFSYVLLTLGTLLSLTGFILLFKKSDVKPERKVTVKPLSFQAVSRQLNAYVKTLPRQHGGANLALLQAAPINELRRQVFRVVGSVLNMTQEQADASTADELIYTLGRRFGRVHIFLIADFLNFLDRAMSVVSSSGEGIEIHRDFITGVMPLLTREELWLSFSQV